MRLEPGTRISLGWRRAMGMHHWEDTFFWLRDQAEARLASTKTYNVAVDACGKSGNWQASLACFRELLLQELQPDAVSFNSASTACTQGSAWTASLALLQQLRSCEVEPDVFTLSAAVCACVAAPR